MAALIASTLLAGCGLRCTSSSTETFTVYEDAPKISQLDLAILGGTGKYMGARGEVTSTRNADGSYTQAFTLLK